MSDKKRYLKWKAVRDEIDGEIAKKAKREISHHRTLVTGTSKSMEHVAFTDGTEKAYTTAQEEKLREAQKHRFSEEK